MIPAEDETAAHTVPAGCAPGTLVLAPRGWIPVERLEPGTHVSTTDGIHHAVRIDRHSRVPIYRVATADGQHLRASGAHRVRAKDASGRPAWTRIGQLRPGDTVETINGPAVVLSVTPDGADDAYAIHEPTTGTCITNGYISRAEMP